MKARIPNTYNQSDRSARMRSISAVILLFAKVLSDDGMPATQIRYWVENINQNYLQHMHANDTWADELDAWAEQYHLHIASDSMLHIPGVYTLTGDVLRRSLFMCLHSLRPLGYGGIRLSRLLKRVPLNVKDAPYTYTQLIEWAVKKHIIT